MNTFSVWGKPGSDARKWHYFTKRGRPICGAEWLYSNHMTQQAATPEGNAACKKCLKAIAAQSARERE